LKILTISSILFSQYCSAQNSVKKITIGKWEAEIPTSWKLSGAKYPNCDTMSIKTAHDTVYCTYKTDIYNFINTCPVLWSEYLFVEGEYYVDHPSSKDTMIAWMHKENAKKKEDMGKKNEEIREKNKKIISEYPDCFNSQRHDTIIDGTNATFLEPLSIGKGLTAIYIYSEEGKNLLSLWGRNLHKQDNDELIKVIRSIRLKK